MAEGLLALHTAGLAHGNLEPGAVLIQDQVQGQGQEGQDSRSPCSGPPYTTTHGDGGDCSGGSTRGVEEAARAEAGTRTRGTQGPLRAKLTLPLPTPQLPEQRLNWAAPAFKHLQALGRFPSHSAPELLAGGAATAAGDAFAFGALLWSLWAGQFALEGVPSLSYVQEGLRPVFVGCPPSYSRLALLCMDADVARRPRMEQVIRELRAMKAASEHWPCPGGSKGPRGAGHAGLHGSAQEEQRGLHGLPEDGSGSGAGEEPDLLDVLAVRKPGQGRHSLGYRSYSSGSSPGTSSRLMMMVASGEAAGLPGMCHPAPPTWPPGGDGSAGYFRSALEDGGEGHTHGFTFPGGAGHSTDQRQGQGQGQGRQGHVQERAGQGQRWQQGQGLQGLQGLPASLQAGSASWAGGPSPASQQPVLAWPKSDMRDLAYLQRMGRSSPGPAAASSRDPWAQERTELAHRMHGVVHSRGLSMLGGGSQQRGLPGAHADAAGPWMLGGQDSTGGGAGRVGARQAPMHQRRPSRLSSCSSASGSVSGWSGRMGLYQEGGAGFGQLSGPGALEHAMHAARRSSSFREVGEARLRRKSSMRKASSTPHLVQFMLRMRASNLPQPSRNTPREAPAPDSPFMTIDI